MGHLQERISPHRQSHWSLAKDEGFVENGNSEFEQYCLGLRKMNQLEASLETVNAEIESISHSIELVRHISCPGDLDALESYLAHCFAI